MSEEAPKGAKMLVRHYERGTIDLEPAADCSRIELDIDIGRLLYRLSLEEADALGRMLVELARGCGYEPPRLG